MHEITSRVDEVRRLKGFLTIAQTLQLADLGVTVIDPFSTLISSRASLGSGVFLWPNVTIEVGPEGSVSIGASTVLHSGVRIEAGAGSIAIGANGDLGREGGFTLVVGAQSDKIDVWKRCPVEWRRFDYPERNAWQRRAGSWSDPHPELPAWRRRLLSRA
ncbi:hypothetical protein [Rhizobium leguminosarum]|uniref:hypothetical protein n=1 Tax=Rhizobium leguminosarum TaxID=384 RepID=UPI0021B0ACC5|nr:hypothetical protein [Rhizobium leguminosarum]